MPRVTEIFRPVQGESTHAGRPCASVRLTGCPLRCTRCDSEDTFTGGERVSVEGVMRRVRAYGCQLVEVAGGGPPAQKEAPALVRRLCEEGLEELAGLVSQSGLKNVKAQLQLHKNILGPEVHGV